MYRVIKNQPPPILSIELDHNPFKCPAPGCTKSFRKASLLHYHIKYYHTDQQLEEQSSAEEAVRSLYVPQIRYGEQRVVSLTLTGAILGFFRRKRSFSEGGDLVSDRRSENSTSGEHGIMGTGTEQSTTSAHRSRKPGQPAALVSFLSCVPVSRSQEGWGEGENGRTG